MKGARRGIRVDGYAAYGHMFEPRGASESEAAMSAALDSPAWGFIQRFLLSAKQLGFDPYDADIIKRATAAGERAHAAQPPPPPTSSVGPVNEHEPIVYYMQLGDLIKIGTTTNIIGRIASLNPERVLAVEPGDRVKEAQRHREFTASRRHGEWFAVTPELLDHIRALRDQFEAASGLTLDTWLARPSPRRKPHTSPASILDSSPSGPGTVNSSPSDDSALADRS